MERTRDQGQTLKRGRRIQAARSRRISVIEGLLDRRVPAALSHDVALVTASTADSRGTTVDNNTEETLMQIKISKFFYCGVRDSSGSLSGTSSHASQGPDQIPFELGPNAPVPKQSIDDDASAASTRPINSEAETPSASQIMNNVSIVGDFRFRSGWLTYGRDNPALNESSSWVNPACSLAPMRARQTLVSRPLSASGSRSSARADEEPRSFGRRGSSRRKGASVYCVLTAGMLLTRSSAA